METSPRNETLYLIYVQSANNVEVAVQRVRLLPVRVCSLGRAGQGSMRSLRSSAILLHLLLLRCLGNLEIPVGKLKSIYLQEREKIRIYFNKTAENQVSPAS